MDEGQGSSAYSFSWLSLIIRSICLPPWMVDIWGQGRHVRHAYMRHASDRSTLGCLACTFHISAFRTCLY